jgi:hypothetical protein
MPIACGVMGGAPPGDGPAAVAALAAVVVAAVAAVVA